MYSRRFLSLIVYQALLLLIAMFVPFESFAHGIAGKRFFPTTFAVDDPFISDEFSMLYGSLKMNDETGGPRVTASSLDIAYSKRITPVFGLEIDEQYQRLHTGGDGSVSGFGNLSVNAKYQFYTNEEHETILSAGIADEVGNTGARSVGSNSFSTLSPAFFFGKGFGDLPDSAGYLRPAAITGVIGPNIPTRETTDGARNPATLTWAFSLQYSLMYLQSFVQDVGLGAPFNRMVGVIEFPMETCLNGDCRNQTTGTVNPGVAWIGKFAEAGLAAQVPMNPRSGAGTGVFVLFHLFIDDLFPDTLGRPVLK